MAHLPLFAALLLAFAATAATAQDVRQYRAGDAVDPREVAEILAQPAPKMRSIRLLNDSPAAGGVAAAAAAPAAQAPGALSLPVQFAFDSADILPAARKQLDALVQGIRLLPETKTVVVQGHTDAAGSEQYNEQLSQRRAQAVKGYLVAAGIDVARLRAVGKGEQAPLPGTDPNASDNRRVQFSGD